MKLKEGAQEVDSNKTKKKTHFRTGEEKITPRKINLILITNTILTQM